MSDRDAAVSAGGHEHIFLGRSHERNERKAWAVIALCSTMMVVEIVGGAIFGSLALVADGLHMSTHAAALLIAALAYSYARRCAGDARFAFGTGKLGDLAGFSSAIILAMIALFIGYEAVARLFAPVAIDFDEAIPVAILGLCVNLASVWLLSGGDHDGHGHSHDHEDDAPGRHHSHAHRDNNMRAAFVHVLADAAVSILAILGLSCGRFFGWVWMDPVMGIVGALVIANWSHGLLRDTAGVLLDMTPDRDLAEELRREIESDGDRLTDLHLWRLGPGHLGAILSIVTARGRGTDFYRARLDRFAGLSHVTIQIESF
jgi:cation diffusion facilitator family transporter